ncbi:MAG: hypothetical protein AAFP84_10165 [Actinomycetota bacterium]
MWGARAVRHVAIVLALLLGVGAAANADAPERVRTTATVAEQAVRVDPPDPPTRALLISDSAWLGLRLRGTVDAVQGTDVTLALASCRRRVATSCRNSTGFVPITLLQELDAHPTGYDTLIVATGYNDHDQRFLDEVDTIIRRARSHDYTRVVWLTLRSNVAYVSPGTAGFAEVFARSNEAIRALATAGTYPELVMADWAAYARTHHSWFPSDGIHLRRLGGYAAADYLSRKLAHLDGLSCPQPVTPDAPAEHPCPDPDATGLTADLAALYPTDVASPEARFELVWEGSSSWPAPAWWER